MAGASVPSALPLLGDQPQRAMLVRGREGLGQPQDGREDGMAPRAGSRGREPVLGVGGEGVSMGSWHGTTWNAWVPTGKPRARGSGPRWGGPAAFKGTSSRLSLSRELGEGDVQRAGPALGAEQASGYLAQSPRAAFLFGSIRLQSKHWQIGIPTWALTNSNRLGHDFQLICLGQKCSACPGLAEESRTLLTSPQPLGPAELSPDGSFLSILPAWWFGSCTGMQGTWA